MNDNLANNSVLDNVVLMYGCLEPSLTIPDTYYPAVNWWNTSSEIIEIFGKKLKVVPDDGINSCELCALHPLCEKLCELLEEYDPNWTYPTVCSKADGDCKRHFELAEVLFNDVQTLRVLDKRG